MTSPLSLAVLATLPSTIQRPAYDVEAARIGIVHLGIGAFHRAHQAVMIDDRLNAGETGWAICGVSLRSPDTCDALAPQDGLYTVSVRSQHGESLRVIGAVRELLVAPEDPPRVLARMANPETKIVSLTVTEKGYCHDPATGELNRDHPDIKADLAQPERPVSAIGYLVEALRLRWKAGLMPFTVLCCDNLPSNGQTVRRVVTAFAHLRDAELGAWVAANVAFPCTMVDRIVPATTDVDRARVSDLLGVEDRWPVVTEPFTQWVIEDDFTLGRPDFAAAGAQITEDVAPFELMKLRLLNGSHSTLAYLGYLCGHETVAEAIADPSIHRIVGQLMGEVTPTLPKVHGHDLAGYKAELLERFANPSLRHRTWQIAMDGSQKLPQRLLASARELLAQGQSLNAIPWGVAGWMRYVMAMDDKGKPIDVRDPMSDLLVRKAQAHELKARAIATDLFGIEAIFGTDLPADPRFTEPVIAALTAMLDKGVAAALR